MEVRLVIEKDGGVRMYMSDDVRDMDALRAFVAASALILTRNFKPERYELIAGNLARDIKQTALNIIGGGGDGVHGR